MKFCPICKYYLYLNVQEHECSRLCRNCGYTELEEKGTLISETLVKERTSEAYKILLNEFTRQDSTLPHLKTMKCPREDCNSNGGGAEKDVIYIKYDTENLKYVYICNVCGEHWRTRT
jgi:DNA-directed RNA polymerase subunit M/transcription elongation factor TFIIS